MLKLLLSLQTLVLISCTSYFTSDSSSVITDEQNDFAVSYKVSEDTKFYITLSDSKPADTYYISYQTGDTAPADCSSAQIETTYTEEKEIPNLTPNTLYSFRVCKKVAGQVLEGKVVKLKTQLLTVEDYYSESNQWNAWVRAADTNTACDGSETSYDACLHAGEVKKVFIENFESCNDLSLSDSLNAFEWSCVVESGKPIFTSILKETTNIKELIDVNSFKQIKVILSYKNKVVNQSSLSTWWGNSFIEISGSSDFIISTDNAIYYIPDSVNFAYDVSVQADNATVVSLGDGVLNGESSSAPVLTTSGSSSSFTWLELHSEKLAGGDDVWRIYGNLHYIRNSTVKGGTDDCVEIGNGNRYLKIVNSDFTSCNYGLYFNGADRVYVNNVRFKDVSWSCLDMGSTEYNEISNVYCIQSGDLIRTNGSGVHYTEFKNMYSLDSPNRGIYFRSGSSFNTIKNLKVINSNSEGLRIGGLGAGNVFINTYIVGSGDTPISLESATSGITFINTLIAFSNGPGVMGNTATNLNLINVMSLRNTNGFSFTDTNTITCVNCSAVNNDTYGINLTGGTSDELNNQFHGNLLISGNGSKACNVVNTSVGTHGIYDTSCTNAGINGSTDFTNSLSTASFYNSIDMTNVFSGVVSSDSENTHGNSLPIAVESITDWLNFENNKRFWVKSGQSMTINSNNRDCRTGENCEIWDFTPNTSINNPILNTSFDYLNGNPAQMGSACPTAVAGSEYVDGQVSEVWYSGINALEVDTDGTGNNNGVCEPGESCFSRFLKHAYEIVDDEFGDNDGLCEASESCIYTPNLGVYQGQGELLSCDYQQNGGLAEISMYYYSTL